MNDYPKILNIYPLYPTPTNGIVIILDNKYFFQDNNGMWILHGSKKFPLYKSGNNLYYLSPIKVKDLNVYIEFK